MKYEILFTSRFKKDLKLVQKQGKDVEKLFAVVELLSNGKKLDVKYKDHELSGNYDGFRECHIEPDWLLIYRTNESFCIYCGRGRIPICFDAIFVYASVGRRMASSQSLRKNQRCRRAAINCRLLYNYVTIQL